MTTLEIMLDPFSSIDCDHPFLFSSLVIAMRKVISDDKKRNDVKRERPWEFGLDWGAGLGPKNLRKDFVPMFSEPVFVTSVSHDLLIRDRKINSSKLRKTKQQMSDHLSQQIIGPEEIRGPLQPFSGLSEEISDNQDEEGERNSLHLRK